MLVLPSKATLYSHERVYKGNSYFDKIFIIEILNKILIHETDKSGSIRCFLNPLPPSSHLFLNIYNAVEHLFKKGEYALRELITDVLELLAGEYKVFPSIFNTVIPGLYNKVYCTDDLDYIFFHSCFNKYFNIISHEEICQIKKKRNINTGDGYLAFSSLSEFIIPRELKHPNLIPSMYLYK